MSATSKRAAYNSYELKRENSTSIFFSALNLENDFPVCIEIEKCALEAFFDGNCPQKNWLNSGDFRENIIDAAEILVRNRAEGVHIVEPKLIGYYFYTTNGVQIHSEATPISCPKSYAKFFGFVSYEEIFEDLPCEQ